MRGHAWTESEDRRLGEMVRAGTPQKEIARLFGVSKQAVAARASRLRERGVAIPKKPGGRLPEDKFWTLERCRQLLVDAQGACDADLAPRYGLSLRSLGAQLHNARRRLAAAGMDVPQRGRTRWTGSAPVLAPRNDEIEALWRAGQTRGEIAVRLGVTIETVKGVLQRRNLSGLGGSRISGVRSRPAKASPAPEARVDTAAERKAARAAEAATRRLAAARILLAAAVGRTDAELAAEHGVKLGTLYMRLHKARRLVAAAGYICPERWPDQLKRAKAAALRTQAVAQAEPILPVALAKPTDADALRSDALARDALPCRIRLGGELLNIEGTGATQDPKYHWRGNLRQARTLITRNALQGAVIERISTGANGGTA